MDEVATVEGFGREWARFDQTNVPTVVLRTIFDSYVTDFPWDGRETEHGIDIGCGSGRWARFVAPRVGRLTCVDASADAAAVARRTLGGHDNVDVVVGSAGDLPFVGETFGFGFAIGVLHHTPDPEAALRDCVRVLRTGAPLLVYLYYDLDGRPDWYRRVWRVSDVMRERISALPFRSRYRISQALAALVYWPLARAGRLSEVLGAPPRVVAGVPLSSYRSLPFAVMRNDALDRFGTRIEHRFSREEVLRLLARTGVRNVELSDAPPFWVAVGTVARPPGRDGEPDEGRP